MGDMAARANAQTLEEIREPFDSLDNLFYGMLWCHQSMKHTAVAQRLRGLSAREQGQLAGT